MATEIDTESETGIIPEIVEEVKELKHDVVTGFLYAPMLGGLPAGLLASRAIFGTFAPNSNTKTKLLVAAAGFAALGFYLSKKSELPQTGKFTLWAVAMGAALGAMETMLEYSGKPAGQAPAPVTLPTTAMRPNA